MSMMKRMLSLLLALALLMGNIPAVAFAEETEIPAETEMVAAEETLAPTEAATEPAETVTPTEVVTEPTVEETVAPTQPAVPEETAAPTEAVTESTPEETTAPTEIADEAALEMQWHTIVPDVDLPDNEELHAAYIEQVLYDNRISTLGIAAGNRLSGDEKLLYDALVPYIKEIANGERASTVISVGQQVGNDYIPEEDVIFTETYATDAAVSETVSHAITALLSDLPFEMYWYDKTAGCSYGYLLDKYGNLLYLVFTFPAAVNYAGSGNGTVNTEKTGAAAEAVHNAESIISEYASSSDYEKLVGYRDEICKLVSYNHDAAGTGDFSGNDDPWQLIYVFDGDPNTNVVCEGYSKAFMYLCDLTDFTGDVTCYTVSGLMNRGGHMWNIVTIGGSNYMADVTNSDDGSVGMYGGLFLVGGAGSAAEGYSFIGVEYTYDNETKSLWGTGADSILTLASEDYDPNAGGVDENIVASGTCGDNLIWVLDKEGILTISGTGKMDIWLNDVPWYEHREAVKMVIIENGVTNIGSSAFEECNNLTSVAIPDSVTQIGSSAFWECGSLEHVEIPDSVTSIGNYAFYYCEKLAQVTIGNGVTSIGKNAFYACSSLESVVIPDSVTSLGEEAFAYCSNLKSVQLPNSITSISEAAFGACISLTSIEIPNTVTSIGDLAFGQCINLVKFHVPNSVTNIGTAAFLYCGSLTEITFEADAPVIASDAFTDVSAIAYYPANNPTWTADVMQNYGGTITWTPVGGEDVPDETEPDVDENTVASGTCGENVTWKLDKEGTLTISGSGAMNDYDMYSDLAPWDPDLYDIKTVIIEDGVTTIGTNAFYICDSLTSLTIGNGVTSIGKAAFFECKNLENVTIGNSVTDIADYAFYYCESLTSIVIPDSVTAIGGIAFQNCESLQSVTIGNGVTTIGGSAFRSCSSLKSITIPESVTSIGSYAFYYCDSLSGIWVSEDNNSYCSDASGVLFNKDKTVLIQAPGAISGDYEIPNTVTSIGRSSFASCGNLTSIVIPDSVTDIGEYTFHICGKLKSVTIGNGVTVISKSAFSSCDSLMNVTIPDTVTTIGDSAFYSCDSLANITIPDSVTGMGTYAFGFCTGLTEITFDGDAPEIAANAFKNVTATAYYPADNATWTEEVMQNYNGTITWVKKAKTIASGTCGDGLSWVLDKEGTLTISGNGATEDYTASANAPWYDYRTEITAIIIESGVAAIGSYAFHGCNSAASIVIPDGVTAIGRYAFLGCKNLTEINLPATVTSIDEGAFWGCKGLTGFVIPDGVTVISDNMFEECSSLTSIEIPDSVNTIGNSAFSCCRALTDIQIPDRVGGLGAGVFFGCSSLVSIEVPFVTAGMFQSCYNLQSVKVRESSITSIGDYAFADCENLVNITLPENLTAIGDSAFHRCWSLPNMEIPDTVTSIGAGAFVVCWGFTDITIPANVKTIGVDAFGSCKNLTTVTFEGDAPKIVTPEGYEEQSIFGEQAIIAYYPADKSGWTEETLQQYGTWVIGVPYNVEGNVIASGAHGENMSWVLDKKGTLTISGNGPMENYDDWTCYRWYYYYGMVENVVIEEGVTTLGDWCFGNMRMKSVKLPESLTSIGAGTFWDCMPLEDISIPEGVASVGAEAFLHCLGLTSIKIPAGVTKIDGYAFANCSNLKKITFEGDAPVFGDGAFFGEMAATAYYPTDNATWTEEVMAACGSTITWKGYTSDGTIASGICGDGLTWTLNRNGLLTIFGTGVMPDYEYPDRAPWDEYCEEIKSIVIKDGVTNISARAFSDLAYLTNIEIPDSVTDIGEGAFNDCWSLSGIVIPDSVTSIGDRAFYFCRSLENVSIGKGVTTIGFDVFDWCSSLSSITIPSGLVSIGDFAFNCCHNLKEIIFEGDAPVFMTDGEEFEPCHFSEVTATAYYPANNPTWTADVMQNYGGTITWKAYGEPQVLPNPVVKAEGNPVTGGGTLIWEDDSEADYYQIYRATSKSGKYKLLETVEGTELEVKVSVGKTYYYKVKAICDADASLNSGYSSVVKVTGKCAQPEIDAAVKPSSGKPVVKWSKVSGAKKYDVYRATEIDGTYKKVKTTTSTSYTDSKATLGTTYYYKVKAVASKSTYNSAYSEIKECLTILAQPELELSINKTTGKPVIEWEKVSGAIGYEILRTESEEGEYTKLANRTELTFEDCTAEPDKDYWYKVNAIGVSENLNNSGDAEMIHATLAKPVVSFGVNSITGKPVMTWEEVDGAVEYKIYRSSKSTKSYKAIATVTETEYVATSASVGKAYYYKVIAIGENDKSAYSSYKKLTAKCARPEITAIGADPATGKPYVDWDKVSGAEKYYVYRATEIDGEYEKVKSTTKTSFTDTKAKVGTEYFYKVKAIASKSTYNSIESEVESCLTVLARPVVTAKNDADTGKVILSWEKVDGAVAYEVYRMGEDGILCQMCTQWELTYTDEGEGTEVDTVYTYTVKAIAENADLNSADSTAVTISAACEKPSISIALDGKKPMVSWDSVEGATKHYVYRSTKKSSGYKKVATIEEGESYTDNKAKKGTTYYYKIVAVSENAKSAYSNVVKIKSK